MNEIKDAIKEIQRDVADIKVSQARMEQDVANHIRRTDLAEQAIADVRKELKPIKTHIAMWAGAMKLITVAGVVIGIVAAAIQLVKS